MPWDKFGVLILQVGIGTVVLCGVVALVTATILSVRDEWGKRH